MCVTQFVREHGTVRYEPGYITDFLFFGAFFLYIKYQSGTHRKSVRTQWHRLMKALCSISFHPICFSKNLAQRL